MRSEPRQRSAFDEARRDPDHFAIRFGSGARTLQLRRDIRRRARRWRAWRDRHFFRLPLSIVPLTNKAAPILNVQIDRIVTDAKRRHLIAVSRSGYDIDAIERPARQRDRLAF